MAEPAESTELNNLAAKLSQYRLSPTLRHAHIIGLGAIKTALDARWERRRDAVLAFLVQTLDRYRAPAEKILPIDGERFLLLLVSRSPAEGQAIAAIVLEQVLRQFLGDGAPLEAIEVYTVFEDIEGLRLCVARPFQAMLERLENVVGPPAAQPATALEEDDLTDLAAADAIPADLAFRYCPMWDVENRALSTFHCWPIHYHPRLGARVGDQILAGGGNSQLINQLDNLVLRHAIRAVSTAFAQGLRFLVSITIHAPTLESRAEREGYIKLCQILPDDLRRAFVFEVAGLDATASDSRLTNIATILRKFGRAVFLRLPVDHRPPANLRVLGFLGAGVYLRGSSLSETRLLRELEGFAAASQRAGLRSYAHGISTRSLATIATTSGIQILDGEAVTPMVDKLRPITRFELEDLFH